MKRKFYDRVFLPTTIINTTAAIACTVTLFTSAASPLLAFGAVVFTAVSAVQWHVLASERNARIESRRKAWRDANRAVGRFQ